MGDCGSDTIEAIGGEDAQTVVEDAHAALQRELSQLKVRALRDRARGCGVAEAAIQNAIKCNDAKTALIYLIVQVS